MKASNYPPNFDHSRVEEWLCEECHKTYDYCECEAEVVEEE